MMADGGDEMGQDYVIVTYGSQSYKMRRRFAENDEDGKDGAAR